MIARRIDLFPRSRSLGAPPFARVHQHGVHPLRTEPVACAAIQVAILMRTGDGTSRVMGHPDVVRGLPWRQSGSLIRGVAVTTEPLLNGSGRSGNCR